MEILTKNTGIIVGQRPEDYVFGSTSPIVHEVRNSSEDWELFRSRDERQNQNPTADRMHCVTASATNIWEQQANWMLANNLWPTDALKFWRENGYIVNNVGIEKFEISRRFTAKKSGTTREGNYFWRVWDSVRTDGVVPDVKYQDDPSLDWDHYYQEIPQDLILLGQQSLKYFSLLYESMSGSTIAQMRIALEMCPLQLGITTQCGWNAEVPFCDMPSNHAVDNDKIRADGSIEIFDSYDPYSKHLAKGYFVPTCYRAVLYPIKRTAPIIPPNTPVTPPVVSIKGFPKDMKFGDRGDDIRRLRDVLNSHGWVNNVTSDLYDKELAGVVFNFQLANISHVFLEMLLTLKGKLVGPRTREVLNKLIR